MRIFHYVRIHSVNEQLKYFVNFLRLFFYICIVNKCDVVIILHKFSDKNSNMDCKLVA